MLLKDFITESRAAPLFHGFRNLAHARTALENDEMLGTTTQRYWPNGVQIKPEERAHDSDYRMSFWMKGISFSRSLRYSLSWGDVVFELDQSKLAQNYKIIPFNWMRNSTKGEMRREAEEFLILEKEDRDYKLPRDEWTEHSDNIDMQAFKQPANKRLKPLSAYLVGIYIEPSFMQSSSGRKDDYQFFIDHPKFKGFKKLAR